MDFSENQIQRYARHILLPEVGGEGQARLLESRVLVVGAGGLGSPLLLDLAAAGVGTLGVIDHDVVDLSNLETMARIVSFVSVGVLMLVIGYLAPLPPSEQPSKPPDESVGTAEAVT